MWSTAFKGFGNTKHKYIQSCWSCPVLVTPSLGYGIPTPCPRNGLSDRFTPGTSAVPSGGKVQTKASLLLPSMFSNRKTTFFLKTGFSPGSSQCQQNSSFLLCHSNHLKMHILFSWPVKSIPAANAGHSGKALPTPRTPMSSAMELP